MHQWIGSALRQIMACLLFSTKPLSEPKLVYCELDSWERISVKFELESYHFHSRKCNWKCRLPKWQPSWPVGDELRYAQEIMQSCMYACFHMFIFEVICAINTATLITCICSWWRRPIETFSVLPAICAGNSPVTGEFPAQRPVMRRFDVFFDLRLNKRLCKQSWGWWFETPSCPLWHHCNVLNIPQVIDIHSRGSRGRQEHCHFVQSISWLQMTWRHKEPGHQQPWYWLSFPG